MRKFSGLVAIETIIFVLKKSQKIQICRVKSYQCLKPTKTYECCVIMNYYEFPIVYMKNQVPHPRSCS